MDIKSFSYLYWFTDLV